MNRPAINYLTTRVMFIYQVIKGCCRGLDEIHRNQANHNLQTFEICFFLYRYCSSVVEVYPRFTLILNLAQSTARLKGEEHAFFCSQKLCFLDWMTLHNLFPRSSTKWSVVYRHLFWWQVSWMSFYLIKGLNRIWI